jgi:hypothetical protein
MLSTGAFLRRVAARPACAHAVPYRLYADLVRDLDLPAQRPAACGAGRHFCVVPLDNGALRGADEEAAQACLRQMLVRLGAKVGKMVLHAEPLEIEASGDATYTALGGGMRSAFAEDETLFRLAVQVPDSEPNPDPAPDGVMDRKESARSADGG